MKNTYYAHPEIALAVDSHHTTNHTGENFARGPIFDAPSLYVITEMRQVPQPVRPCTHGVLLFHFDANSALDLLENRPVVACSIMSTQLHADAAPTTMPVLNARTRDIWVFELGGVENWQCRQFVCDMAAW